MSDDSVSYALEQFFGGNFHPDWDFEANDWPEIVDNYVAGEPPQQLRALASDIDVFRNSVAEDDLHSTMMNIGGFYDPRPKMTYKTWLGQVADRLRQHAEACENRGTN